jgi:hypothetical protein
LVESRSFEIKEEWIEEVVLIAYVWDMLITYLNYSEARKW